MKRAALICPERRKGIEDVIGDVPLVLAVYLGKPFIDHALYGLARQGFGEVRVFASDRPSEIRDYLGNGSAWGLQVEIIPTQQELVAEDARRKKGLSEDDLVLVLDRLPQALEVDILRDYSSYHDSRNDMLPILARGQVGVREHSPGVWVGMKTRISPTAKIEPPCWIGHQVTIGANVQIGPNSFIENDSLIDAHAEVANSTVGARTYLGGMTHLAGSIACGSMLVNRSNHSLIRLKDAFLLCHLDTEQDAASGYLLRLTALFVVMLSCPLILVAILLAPLRRKPWCIREQAVLYRAAGKPLDSVFYYDYPSLPAAWSRWPRLLRIITGHFSWTGNPPITPEEANLLESEFERLWLHVPPALFTAPEAEGCLKPWDDEAKAHAALFASRSTYSWRLRILARGLLSLIYHPSKIP